MAISDIKAKVGSVTFNKGKLAELLGKKINKFYDNIGKIIYKEMGKLGEKIRDEVRLKLMASTGSRRWYKYVEYDKELKRYKTLFKWQASLENKLPAAVSKKIANAIDYRIFSEKGDILGEFTIGVWSTAKGSLYPTVAFRGGPSKNKKGELRKGEEEGVGKLFVDYDKGRQYPLKLIAEKLEHGREGGKHPMEPRPFLSPLFKKYIEEFKKETRKMMRQALLDAMGKSTLPVYFKFYLREEK
jgi:hypothetical protein